MKAKHWAVAGAGIAAAMALVPYDASSAGTVDATTGASIQVIGGTTTDTAATINWKMIERAGEGNCTINLLTPTARAIAVPASARTNESVKATYTFGGLTAATTYTFTINTRGSGGSARSNQSKFVTDPKKSAGILLQTPYGAARPTTGYDAFGRRLGRVVPAGVRFGAEGPARFVPVGEVAGSQVP